MVNELARALKDNPPVFAVDGGFIEEGYNKELDYQNTLKDKAYELVAGIYII